MSRKKKSRQVAPFQDRVRLYLQVMLAIDFAGYLGDLPLLLSGNLPPLPLTSAVLRWGVTGVLFLGWLLAKFGEPKRSWLVVLESAVTFGLGVVYVRIGMAYPMGPSPEFGAVMALFGVVLLLVVRSALVPSHVLHTAVLGMAAYGAGLYVIAQGSVDAFEPSLWESMIFLGVAFVVATSVTSKVIYGLRAQVHDAMQMGQYTLEQKLGAGGMGEVYRARHSRLRRATAVKLLPPSRSSEEAVLRFESEVQLTAALTHPNTIRIYDYGRTDEGIFYYAMEHLGGATLSDVVAVDGPQPPARVIRVLEQAAGALQEAHEAGLVHRDIKPSNMMLTRQGVDPDAVKVLDFGLVRQVHGRENDDGILEGVLVGTPLYMAPEVIAGAETPEPASDLYALGAVAYFLVTGTHVFSGATLMEMCAHHLHSDPELPSSRVARELPADFEALIMACLSKQPSRRPKSAAALLARLQDCADHGKWSAEDAQRWWKQHTAALEGRAESQRAAEPPSPTAMTVAASA